MPYITIIGKEKYRTQESRIVYLTGDVVNAIIEWLSLRENIAFAQQQIGHTSANIAINNYANGSYGMKDILKKYNIVNRHNNHTMLN